MEQTTSITFPEDVTFDIARRLARRRVAGALIR